MKDIGKNVCKDEIEKNVIWRSSNTLWAPSGPERIYGLPPLPRTSDFGFVRLGCGFVRLCSVCLALMGLVGLEGCGFVRVFACLCVI